MDSEVLVFSSYLVLAATIGATVIYLLLRPKLLRAEKQLHQTQLELEDVKRLAEAAHKEALLAAKEEAMNLRSAAEAEIREMRQNLQRQEQKLELKEELLENRRSQIDEREHAMMEHGRALALREDTVRNKELDLAEQLRSMTGIGEEEALRLYLERIEDRYRELGMRRAKEIASMTAIEAERKVRKILLSVMERTASQHVAESTVSVVNLPSEDMKGRLIGREGRNIRSFEQVAGVDLIIDDTPEAVVISSFDPIRRETARLALMNLMLDGRIHPGRIEELVERAQAEIQRVIEDAGERAAEEAAVGGLPPKVLEMMGRLRFRTSYAQNVLDHSVEVAKLASSLAHELGFNPELARRAGFLHDIGKGLPEEWEGPHALTGMEFLRYHGEKEATLNAVGAHHCDIEPANPEAHLVIVADILSAARPGSRRESLDSHIKRLAALEALANSFPSVDRSYAVQAGREVRLIVRPEEIDDLGAARLAAEVAQRIERELEYPGQVKVTVIRETRAQEVAR